MTCARGEGGRCCDLVPGGGVVTCAQGGGGREVLSPGPGGGGGRCCPETFGVALLPPLNRMSDTHL